MLGNLLLKSHFFKPKNILNENIDNINDFTVVRLGSINLGNEISLYFKCCQTTKIVENIKFKVYGNPYLIASLSYLTEKLINKPLEVALIFSSKELIDVFDIPATKKYSAYMVEDALKQAVNKWQESND